MRGLGRLRRRSDERVRRARHARRHEAGLLAGAVLADLHGRRGRRHRAGLRQAAQGVGRHVLELGGDRLAALGQGRERGGVQ
eukprot:gene18912-26783_t